MKFVDVIRAPKGYRFAIESLVCSVYEELNLKEPVIVRFMSDSNFCGFHDEIDYDDEKEASEISINRNLFGIPPINVFRTICHELYHAYQRENKIPISERNAERAAKKKFKKFYSEFRKSYNEANKKYQ